MKIKDNTQYYGNKTKLLLIPTVILIIVVALQSGCTKNSRVKNWGGSAEYELEPGQKLEEVTWKDDNLWILTRPMTEDDVAETHIFQESSLWSVMEGKVIIKESKK